MAKALGILLYYYTSLPSLSSSNTNLMGNIQDKPIPLKLKRLARDHERFLWALSIVQSRSVNLKLRMGAFIQDANVLVPYAGISFLCLIFAIAAPPSSMHRHLSQQHGASVMSR